MNLINDFIESTTDYESPTSFWRWAAYALVAGTLRDNVYIDHGIRKTYPNIYVVMLADSAEYRKSGPFVPVVSLLNQSGKTKVFQGRTSIQSVLQDLSQDIGSSYAKGISIKGGSGVLIAEELASFFVDDPQCIPILTDIYDYREIYPYNLKSGKIVIKNLCITMLAASNETFLKEVYTNRAVYGGLLGRTFMVKPDERREANSLLNINPNKFSKDKLLSDLRKISELKGAVVLTSEAKEKYDKWYKHLYKSYNKIKDRTGVTQRIHVGALKLALILATSRGEMVITENDIEEAILQTTALRSNYEVYAMSSGKGTQAEIGSIFLNTLFESPGNQQSKKEILMRHWHEITSEELDKLVITLDQAGLITTTVNGTSITYKMTDKCLEVFRKEVE
jgi:hypothetical protein